MIYILNKKVIFDSSQQTLRGIADSDRRHIKLNAPVSRCLLFMINNSGKTLDHSTFIDEVWRKLGMEVAVNTLYQNISLLRRALKDCGMSDDVIITIPKQGINFTASIAQQENMTEDNLNEDFKGYHQEKSDVNHVSKIRKKSFSLRRWLKLSILINLIAIVLSSLALIIVAYR